jgi:hypothetical protein
MKVFKDLEFKLRDFGGVGATHTFENGITISVQAGSGPYSTPRKDLTSPDDFSTFEVALMDVNSNFNTKDFTPNTSDDVLGWQDRGEINALMLLIQSS